MTVREVARLFVMRRRIFSIVVLLGILIAGLVYLLRPTTYAASTTLYVAATVTNSPNNAYQGAQLSQQRVSSYVELATNTRVTRQVVQDLGLAETPEELSRKLSASAGSQSVVIVLTASDRDASRAAAIANDAANVLRGIVDQIETPPNSQTVQAVSLKTVEPAVEAMQATPGLRTSLLYGLLSGLALGVGAIFLANSLDTRVRDRQRLSELLDLPNLGVTIRNAISEQSDSVLLKSPRSIEAEAYKVIRTNLRFLDVDGARKILFLTSALEREGKTTTVLNLATTIAESGLRVLVIDGDLRRPKIATRLALDDAVGLSTVLSGRIDANDAIQSWEGGKLHVLTSGAVPPNPSELLGSNQMRLLLDQLRTSRAYDYVIIDTPPVLPVADSRALAPATDGAVLLVKAGKTKIAEALAAEKALRGVDCKILGSILTIVDVKKNDSTYHYYSDQNDALSGSDSRVNGSPTHRAAGDRSASFPRSRP